MAEKKNKNEKVEDAINETQISFVNEDGTEELCQILFTFHDEVSKKNYMFFYPVGQAEEKIEYLFRMLGAQCSTGERQRRKPNQQTLSTREGKWMGWVFGVDQLII